MEQTNNFVTRFLLFGSLMGVLVTLLTAFDKFKTFFTDITGITVTSTFVSVSAEVLNLVVLLIFYWIIKAKELELNDAEIKTLSESLNISKTKAKFNNDRVNKLVEQISFCLGGFMFFLIFFYAIEILEDTQSYWKLPDSKFPFLQFLENFSNVVSAAFIYLAFSVLYDVTLDEKNRPKIYYRGTIIFLVAFIGTYTMFLLTEDPNSSSSLNVTNVFRLICGVYNGLAMGLLFGRFVSMEYFFKDITLNQSNNFTKRFYYIGTIFILPLYVIAQPMFGVFNLIGFGDQLVFKAIVFLVCFIGKTFFLFFFYTYVKKRWFHTYLHLSLANHAIPKNIAQSFPQIEDVD